MAYYQRLGVTIQRLLTDNGSALHRFADHLARQAGGHHFHEGVHVIAQEHPRLHPHARGVRAEQVPHRQADQVGVAARVVRDAGDDADAQPHVDIGLDHVGVDGFEHDIRVDALVGEYLVDRGTAGKGPVVRHDGVFGQLGQRQAPRLAGGQFGKRVVGAHHHRVLPGVDRQGRQAGRQRQRLGGQRQVGLLVQHHFGQLRRAALCQRQVHLGKLLAKGRNHARQQVARLRMGAGDHQPALVAAGELVADLLQVVDFAHDAVDHLRNGQPGLGQPLDALAVPLEDLDAELVLEFDDRLRDARLRGIEHPGGFGKVEVAPDGFAHKTELLQVHELAPVRRSQL
ncbi:hypothetical protein BOPE631_04085 [Bordetella pertussis]